MAEPRLRYGRIGSPEGVTLENPDGSEALATTPLGTRLALLDKGGQKFDPRAFKEGMGVGNAGIDTEGFQLAIAAAQAAPNGVVVFRGGYAIGETLIVPRFVGLVGVGPKGTASSLGWHGAAAVPMIQAGDNSGNFQSGIVMGRFTLANSDGTATWGLKLNKSAYGNIYHDITFTGTTIFTEGGIDVANGSIVNSIRDCYIQGQPIGIRAQGGCNGIWIRGGQIYGNTIGIQLLDDLSCAVIADLNLEDNLQYAIWAYKTRGLLVSGARVEENYPSPNDVDSAQVYLEACSGAWEGGYIVGSLSQPETRANYGMRFVNSGYFQVNGLSERGNGINSIVADVASARRVTLGANALETPVDTINVNDTRVTYAARVSRVAAQSVASGNSPVAAVAWDTEDFDTAGAWDAAHPERLTAIREGKYRIDVNVLFGASPTDGRRVELRLYSEGGVLQTQHTTYTNPVQQAGTPTSVQASILYDMPKGYWVEVFVSQHSGGALDVTGWCSFERIGER